MEFEGSPVLRFAVREDQAGSSIACLGQPSYSARGSSGSKCSILLDDADRLLRDIGSYCIQNQQINNIEARLEDEVPSECRNSVAMVESLTQLRRCPNEDAGTFLREFTNEPSGSAQRAWQPRQHCW